MSGFAWFAVAYCWASQCYSDPYMLHSMQTESVPQGLAACVPQIFILVAFVMTCSEKLGLDGYDAPRPPRTPKPQNN
eukprot:4005781-Amphidinium_carterae.1